MARKFILAFGGAGAKVMESVVMLMAAGAFGEDEIIPLLIDLDTDNGNACRCIQLMDMYAGISNAIGPNRWNGERQRQPGFFDTRLRKITDLREGFRLRDKDSPWRITPPREALRDNFSIDLICRLNPSNDHANLNTLMLSLFGNKRENGRVSEQSVFGAGGDRSIARLMYGVWGMRYDVRFMDFLHIVNTSDKIVVVGSTFGNIGSAGIMEVLRLLRQSNRHLYGAEIAFVLLDPYFYCGHTATGDIFKRKGESFYEAYENFHDILKTTYRIKSDLEMRIRDSVEMGMNQYNPSLPSELMAAIAIKDFFSNDTYGDERREIECILREGNRNDINELFCFTPDFLNDDGISSDVGYFSIFAYCNKEKDFLNRFIDGIRRRRLPTDQIESNTDFPDKIRKFMDLYVRWWEEMAVNSNGRFKIFDFNAMNVNRLIAGRVIGGTGFARLFIGLEDSYKSIYQDAESDFYRNFRQNRHAEYAGILSAFKNAAIKFTSRPFRPSENN